MTRTHYYVLVWKDISITYNLFWQPLFRKI